MSYARPERDDGYKWVALSNTALDLGNVNYLLWAIIGYMIATAVLVMAFGRLGDQFGRARMYNLGLAIFTAASVALSLLPGQGDFAAGYLISVRMIQGIGGALLMANSTAILTDAFPAHQRGLALGINVAAAIGGAVHRLADRRPAG